MPVSTPRLLLGCPYHGLQPFTVNSAWERYIEKAERDGRGCEEEAGRVGDEREGDGGDERVGEGSVVGTVGIGR